jgi:hypothetical protein
LADTRARFKPFPRIKDWKGGKGNQQRPYNYEAVREMYLDGPDYDWPAFCNRNGFNQAHRIINRLDFSGWKRDWLKRHAQLQDEDLAPEALAIRKLVAGRRMDFVRDWVKRTQYMKVLLDATLMAHGEALQHDERNKGLIAHGDIDPKFKMTADDLSTLATAASRIQEIETKALLIVSEVKKNGSDPDADSTGEDNRPEILITTLGQSGVSAGDSVKLLAAWFDQKPEAAAVTVSAEEDLPDAGDTS